MKNLILASAIVCLAGTAIAQKMEVGGNVGLNYTSVTEHITPNVSLQAAYNVCSGFQVGIRGGITKVGYSRDISSEIQTIAPLTEPVYALGTQAIHTVKVFANVNRNTGKVTFYSGASAGVVKAIDQNTNFKGKTNAPMSTLNNGYSVGVQAGATYNVTKRLGVNAEIGADYINMKGHTGDYNRSAGKTNLSVINMPLTVGFRYKLSCPCAKSCPVSKKNN
jgi:hypothetical protein